MAKDADGWDPGGILYDDEGIRELRERFTAIEDADDAGTIRASVFRMLERMTPEKRRSLNQTQLSIYCLEQKAGWKLDTLRKLVREFESDPKNQ